MGAKIVGLIEQSQGRMLGTTVPEASTDLSGTFSMELPALAEGVQLTVFPPGFAARQVRIDARSTEPVFITVEPYGGALKVRHGEVPRQRVWIFKTFVFPFYPYLINWADSNGEANEAVDALSVPMLDPGYYTACKDPGNEVLMTGQLPTGLGNHCVGGTLPPYGELVLDLSRQ